MASVALSAIAVYLVVIATIRIGGKRSTSKMNNFDWVVTVATGGLTASGILLKDVAVADAATGIVMLTGLQWMTTWLVLRSPMFCRLVKPSPTLLVDRGELLEANMRAVRVSEAEINAALRERGMSSLDEAQWVILETDATFSVVPSSPDRGATAPLLDEVANPG